MGALGEIDAKEAAIGLGGRFPRCLFAAFSNVAPGVDFERFQRWYVDTVAAALLTAPEPPTLLHSA